MLGLVRVQYLNLSTEYSFFHLQRLHIYSLSLFKLSLWLLLLRAPCVLAPSRSWHFQLRIWISQGSSGPQLTIFPIIPRLILGRKTPL